MALAAPVAAGPAESVLSAVNAARAKAGCAPLRANPKLMAAARSHARAMAEQNFFGHAGKDGSRFSSRIKRQGYDYRTAAENIAAGQKSATEVVRSWLNSAGHRRNMLNCAMRDTGIALVYQPDDRPIRGNRAPLRYYWVQVFAAPG
ncbi:CAP domain-containing protein [Tabrizicola flagellatus]|uniref:CAP domain-containing protein n=1 Tax=Tabrizicola flagellatus TaxID=2593021 RepID=UPI00135BEC21|nr:CAP domain-containing protein [Tabrizicola flagellatus]